MGDNFTYDSGGKGEGNFGLPGDYFRKSATSIFNKVAWEEEHREFPQLRTLKGNSGFCTPEDYFEKSGRSLELIDIPELRNYSRKAGFTLPNGYFERLDLAQQAFTEDLVLKELEAYPGLGALRGESNFKVPAGYFEQREKVLTMVLTSSSGAKILRLVRRSGVYAAAAMLLLVLSVWAYAYYFKPVEVKDCGTIACVDKMDLLKTKNLEVLDNDELYELVNPTELEKNLQIKVEPTQASPKADSGLNDLTIDDVLDEIEG